MGGGDPAAVVSSPPLRMAGAGLALRVCGCGSLLQVLWPGAAQGPGGFPTRCTRALRRALKISCTRAACAAWASVPVQMAGCSRSPSASTRIWWITVLDNTPVVIGQAVGPARLAGPFAWPTAELKEINATSKMQRRNCNLQSELILGSESGIRIKC